MQVDIYAHNLEEHIKHLRKTLEKEKSYNNTVLSSMSINNTLIRLMTFLVHMPMTAVESLRNETSVALHEVTQSVVICM